MKTKVSSKIYFFLISAALGIGLLTHLSLAAEPKEESKGLASLIQEALENNPELKSMKFDALAKEAEAGPAGAYEDPMVEIEAMNYPVDTWSSQEMGMTGTQLSLKQKVPFPGKLTKKRNATRYEFRAREGQFISKQLETIKNVKKAYVEFYIAQKRLSILQERRNLTRQLIVAIRNKYAVGKTSQAELLGMQVEESNLINETLAADRDLKAKSAELNIVVGRSADHPMEKSLGFEKTVVDFKKLDQEILLKKLTEKNPELRGTEAESLAAREKHSLAKWGYLPDFEFTFRYTFRNPNMDDRGVDVVSAGVGLSIPLWFVSRQVGEVRASGHESARAEAFLDQKRLQLQKMLLTTLAEAAEADQRTQVFEGGLLPLARQAVVTSQSAYLAGKLDFGVLLTLINKRYESEFEYFEARGMRETKIAEIEALIGESLGGEK